MSTNRIDPEVLAAFINGTATDEERAAVLALLASDKLAHAQYVEMVAVNDALAKDAAPLDARDHETDAPESTA